MAPLSPRQLDVTLAIDFEDTSIAYASMTNAELIRAWLLFRALGKPWIVKAGPALTQWAIKLRLPIKKLIEETLFSHFCGGKDLESCIHKAEELSAKGIGTILDFAREGHGQETDFEAVTLELKRSIDMAASRPKQIPFAVFKPSGLGRMEVLAKRDRGELLSSSEEKEFMRIKTRFQTICRYASDKNVRIMIDAEESWIQDSVDAIVIELMKEFNKDTAIVYNTVQLYRHDRLKKIKEWLHTAQLENYQLGLKIVRGAYLEKENLFATQQGRQSPLNPTKQLTDQLYDEALKFCIENLDWIAICAGTHNEASVQKLVNLMILHKVEPNNPRVVFAQLLGMSDNITYNLIRRGYHSAKYVPYGTVEELLPYLTRRAQENSSILGQSSRELTRITKEVKRRRVSSQ